MRRLLLCVALILSAALLGGCPMYSTAGDYPACGANGQCFDCPAGSAPSGGTCIPWQCTTSSDCPQGYACSANRCMLGTASDCSAGCPANYICKLAGGRTQCVPASSQSGPSGDAAAATDSNLQDGGSDGPFDAPGLATDASDASKAADVGVNGFDAIDAFDSSTEASDAIAVWDASSLSDVSEEAEAADVSEASVHGLCNADVECGGGGAKCIDGVCTQQSSLCSDSTQCIAIGESCVDGVCEPHCSVSAPCPSGYGCDFIRGVCNVNSNPCASPGSTTCQGGSICVEGRCVAPCAAVDGAGACPGGQLCVHGGCIPDQGAKFECKNDGQSGQLATGCSALAICLHHDCYVACDPDASATACSDPTSSCKQVVVTAGTYDVCGTAANLGSDCDPAAGKYCSSGLCIDGYCK